ncbi:MAG: FAD-dependent oxidoreductase [Planctomycetaceae bacterium]
MPIPPAPHPDRERLPQGMWDVVVIGAGPAGCAAAIEAARAGRGVLLVERTTFPRYKVCGGCVNPRALADLADLGCLDAVRATGAPEIDRFRWSAGGRTAEIPLPGGVAISRAALDEILLNSARQAGCTVVEGSSQPSRRTIRSPTTNRPLGTPSDARASLG